ncbi:MAG: RNA polymerase sigma factor [Pseudomonadota bacterium]
MAVSENDLPEDENLLIARAQADDRGAFEQLLEQNYDFIFRTAWRWTANREDAEDIAQEVCIRFGHAIQRFKGKSSLRTFLYAMILNAVRDHGRKIARESRNKREFHAHELTQVPAPHEQEIGNHEDEQATALWEAVRQLPDRQRDAVMLVHGEGVSHSEAAKVMDCTEKTVSWHIHEARKRLKQIMQSGGSDNV